jgi:hypothetical protein
LADGVTTVVCCCSAGWTTMGGPEDWDSSGWAKAGKALAERQAIASMLSVFT